MTNTVVLYCDYQSATIESCYFGGKFSINQLIYTLLTKYPVYVVTPLQLLNVTVLMYSESFKNVFLRHTHTHTSQSCVS